MRVRGGKTATQPTSDDDDDGTMETTTGGEQFLRVRNPETPKNWVGSVLVKDNGLDTESKLKRMGEAFDGETNGWKELTARKRAESLGSGTS